MSACTAFQASYASCPASTAIASELFMSLCSSQLGARDAAKAGTAPCEVQQSVAKRMLIAGAALEPQPVASNCDAMCRFATTCSATFSAVEQCTQACETRPTILLRDDYDGDCKRTLRLALGQSSTANSASATSDGSSVSSSPTPIWTPLPAGTAITARIEQCQGLNKKNACPGEIVDCWENARSNATPYTAEADQIDRELRSAREDAANSQLDPLAEWRAYPIAPLTPNQILMSCADAARVREQGREKVSAERFRYCVAIKTRQQSNPLWYRASVEYVTRSVLGVPEMRSRCGQMYPLYQAQHCFEAFVDNTVAIAHELETLTPADPAGSLARLDETTKKSVGRAGCAIMIDRVHPTPFDVASVGASIQYAHKILEEDAVAARRKIAEYYDKSKQLIADWRAAIDTAVGNGSSTSVACRDATSSDAGLVPQYFADCLKMASLWRSGLPVVTRAGDELLMTLRLLTLNVSDTAIPSQASLTPSKDLQRKVDALMNAYAAYAFVVTGKKVDWDKSVAAILTEEPSLSSMINRWKTEAEYEHKSRDAKEHEKQQAANAGSTAGCNLDDDGTIAAVADLMGELEVTGQPAPVSIATYAGKANELRIAVSSFSRLSASTASEVAARFVRARSNQRGLGLKFSDFRTKCSAGSGLFHLVTARTGK